MIRMITAVLMLATLSGPAMLAQVPVTSSASAGQTAVGPRDVLDIRVIEDPSISARVAVSDEGQIALTVVGKVDVSGLSSAQIETKLKTLLEAQYIRKATVAVQVVEYGSRPISVVGAVANPGRIGASSNMTLIQAITQAGGLAAGYGKELVVLRTASNGLTEQLTVNIDDLLLNGNPDLNIPLAPNDLINVPVDTPLSVYVMGEVMKPSKVQFRRSQNPTLLQAIADAGGLTDRAGRDVRIIRMVNGKEENTSINYRDIIRGRKADPPLQDGDRIVVKESFL